MRTKESVKEIWKREENSMAIYGEKQMRLSLREGGLNDHAWNSGFSEEVSDGGISVREQN